MIVISFSHLEIPYVGFFFFIFMINKAYGSQMRIFREQRDIAVNLDYVARQVTTLYINYSGT